MEKFGKSQGEEMAYQPLSCSQDFPIARQDPGLTGGVSAQNAKCGRVDRPGSRDTSALLAKMVEGEIIPRLMLAHKPQSSPAAAGKNLALHLGLQFTDTFARMVLANEPDQLLSYVTDLIRGGINIEVLYFEVLAAAARRLGDYWSEDIICFADLTIGLGRLQQVVRMLGLGAHEGAREGGLERSAFFAACPGEQHTFGLAIVDDFFHRAGWRTCVEPAASEDEIADAVGTRWFDLFGLNASCSISCDAQLDVLTSTIISVRRVSRNRDMTVIVGGRLFHEHPELAHSVGADATAAGESMALLIA